jgi:hypothetical protein
MGLKDELEKLESGSAASMARRQVRASELARREIDAILRPEHYAPVLPGGIDFISSRPISVAPEERQADEFMKGLKKHARLLETSLNENQELHMYCSNGYRVLHISMPSHNVVAMHCLDHDGNETHVTGHMNSVTFEFVIHTLVPPETRRPIGFNMPSSSSE